MSNDNFEQRAYEISEIWEEDWFDEKARNRIRVISSLVSKDAESLLDVGCGNGMFVNHICNLKTVGEFSKLSKIGATDRSHAALQKINNKNIDVIRSNIDSLPFENNSYDTVTCLEVIEHLRLDTYSKALDEIYRIAKKKIIIAVPYNQDLKNSLTTCTICQTRFNVDFHMHSFDEKKIVNLFAKYNIKPQAIIYIEKDIKRGALMSSMLSFFNKSRFPSYAICPVCGYNEHHNVAKDLALQKDRNSSSRPSLKDLIKKILPKKPVWIAGVYEKNWNN